MESLRQREKWFIIPMRQNGLRGGKAGVVLALMKTQLVYCIAAAGGIYHWPNYM